jgi:hypothetical protein
MSTPEVDQELKDALAKAKASTDKPRTVVAVYRAPHGKIMTAHGVEHRDGRVHIEEGHGYISGSASSLKGLGNAFPGYGTKGLVDYTDAPAQADPAKELRDAAEAAKSEPSRYKAIVVAYRKPGMAVKTAHGAVKPGGAVSVQEGHGVVSGWEPSLDSLRDTMDRNHMEHHIAFIDEA